MRKAQAALEYLLTYGWVFMVIFFTLSALAYFGFLSPANMLPKKCDISPGFTCVDMLINVSPANNEVRVLFTNDFNTPIYFTEADFSLSSEYWNIPIDDCVFDNNPLGSYQQGEMICYYPDTSVDFPGSNRVWFSIEGIYNAGVGTQDHKMFVNIYGMTID